METKTFFRQPWLILGSLLLWIVGALVLGFWIGSNQTQMPGSESAEVGFTRDMIMHHSNAVEMAILMRDRSEDEEIRILTLDIMMTQQAQIGQMQGWFSIWGQPLAQLQPAMAWMGTPIDGLMPGMASPEVIAQLRSLPELEAEGLFLNQMIKHHQAGVEMAQAILEYTPRPEVRVLAESIIISQSTEIEAMRDLLRRKGLEVEEDTPPMHHGS